MEIIFLEYWQSQAVKNTTLNTHNAILNNFILKSPYKLLLFWKKQKKDVTVYNQ